MSSGAGSDRADGVIAVPESIGRVVLLGEVLFHREALARALDAYADIAVIGSVADVHAALLVVEESSADALVVDSPSDDVARALSAHAPACKIVFIGSVGDCCRQLGTRVAALFVGATSSLDEVHAALRFARPRPIAPFAPDADSVLTSREQEVRRLLARGCSNKEIATACGISIATVKNHVHHILGKLNVQRRAQVGRLSRE